MSLPEDAQQATPLRRLLLILTRAELLIGAIALLTILVLVFLQAAQRYLPWQGLSWTGELAQFSLIWLTFSAAGVLVTTRGHIALELVDSFRNPLLVRSIHVFALLTLTVIGLGLAREAWVLIGSQGIITSPSLGMPMSWVYVPILIGLASTTIRAAVAAVDVILHGVPASDYDEFPAVESA